MTYRVLGTREKLYRVETRDDLTAWVDDEIGAMAEGWLPITSELAPDGSMRVTYGKLPDELIGDDPEVRPVPAGGGIKAGAGRAVTSLLVLCVIVVAALAMLGLVSRDI
jgi:hypothetical protein